MMADDTFSCIKEVTKVVNLTILPSKSSNAFGAVCEILESWKSHYIQQLKGIVVGFKNVSLVSKRGYIKVDNPVIYCDVKATFDLFYPSVDSFVKARINRVSDDSIGCLIHNAINVAINRKLNVVKEASEFIALDRFILFQINRIILKRKLIHLKGKITDECVKLMNENDIFKREVVAVENNDLTAFSNSLSDVVMSSSNETANTEENPQHISKKAKKRKRESLGDESSHKKKRKITESDSDKSKDKSPKKKSKEDSLESTDENVGLINENHRKSPKKKKKSKKDTQEITDENVGSERDNGVFRKEVDAFDYSENPEFGIFTNPSELKNHIDNEITNLVTKSADITKASETEKGGASCVDNIPKKKRKSNENSDKSKDKSPKKKKKEKSRKDLTGGSNECLSLVSKNITLENEANNFNANGLPELSSPASPENRLVGEIENIDLSKSPDISKTAKKRKRESLALENLSRKKRKINETDSVKSKEKSRKKKKKDKLEKDSKKISKKGKKKKSKDKVISTKKRLHGYKTKLKKKSKDKDKKSKKKKSKSNDE